MLNKLLKRSFDIIFSLIVLFAASPIFVLASLLIILDSGFPVIFRQKRVGKGGSGFSILKFRTMKNTPGELLTASADQRITRSGRILRRTNFDELPQFINIALGDMSVVGPRPEIPEVVKSYTQKQREILSFKPGFTSYATVKFLNEEAILKKDNLMDFYLNQVLPKKIEYDLDYFKNKSSLLRDLVIILKTLGGTLHG